MMRRSLMTCLALTMVSGAAVSQTEYNLTYESTEFVDGFARVNGLLFGGMSGIDYDPIEVLVHRQQRSGRQCTCAVLCAADQL